MRTVVVATAVFVTALASVAVASDEPTIQQLDWLIGAWSFDDAQVGDGDYRETGTRVCRYTLDDQYIVCESEGTSGSGKTRTYVWYINYNDADERFELTTLLGNYPRKLLYTMDVSDDGRTIELKHHSVTAEGVTAEGTSTIEYDGRERYVWNIRGGEPDPETGERRVTFRDTVTRR